MIFKILKIAHKQRFINIYLIIYNLNLQEKLILKIYKNL